MKFIQVDANQFKGEVNERNKMLAFIERVADLGDNFSDSEILCIISNAQELLRKVRR